MTLELASVGRVLLFSFTVSVSDIKAGMRWITHRIPVMTSGLKPP